MTMSELPGDVVEEILCHVPAASLKRLRSTCKRWNLLFDDPRFVREHFDKAVRVRQLMTKELKICSVNVNHHGVLSIDVSGKLNLINRHFILIRIAEVFHHDGLLLCTIKYSTSLVLWNPCTGQAKCIPAKDPYKTRHGTFALGSYQDKKSGYNSYKILSYDNGGTETKTDKFSIYEFKSNSWKILDVTLDFDLTRIDNRVTFKGKTYWFAVDEKENHHAIFLLSFDYTTERFGRMNLPYQLFPYISRTDMALSVVRDEKLFVLLQLTNTSRTEVWVTNKIDETKVVPWSMVLAVDHSREDIMSGVRFLVDDEKKFVVCFDWKSLVKDGKVHYENMVHIIKEDNKVRKVDFAAPTKLLHWSQLFNYVPSLVQIQ
ncbi:PREDICTED: probable F-box protein At5g47300 [Camelina sativa]|uniref:Probable F-box protein At5g47300 n=1 Tax=Camelina sativa TaxID=90675 RepID=A0ABM0WAJ2_CAMSA|nr:PREDICTED: probable F-box protein At5g47300 [Camelina sativa]